MCWVNICFSSVLPKKEYKYIFHYFHDIWSYDKGSSEYFYESNPLYLSICLDHGFDEIINDIDILSNKINELLNKYSNIKTLSVTDLIGDDKVELYSKLLDKYDFKFLESYYCDKCKEYIKIYK